MPSPLHALRQAAVLMQNGVNLFAVVSGVVHKIFSDGEIY